MTTTTPASVPANPSTVAEAVAYLLRIYTIDMEAFLKCYPTADTFVTKEHHNLGRAIRNNFGLWHDNAALRTDCWNQAPTHIKATFVKHWQALGFWDNSPSDTGDKYPGPGDKMHADDCSWVILDALYNAFIANNNSQSS